LCNSLRKGPTTSIPINPDSTFFAIGLFIMARDFKSSSSFPPSFFRTATDVLPLIVPVLSSFPFLPTSNLNEGVLQFVKV
jgi:hypothetical protein